MYLVNLVHATHAKNKKDIFIKLLAWMHKEIINKYFSAYQDNGDFYINKFIFQVGKIKIYVDSYKITIFCILCH